MTPRRILLVALVCACGTTLADSGDSGTSTAVGTTTESTTTSTTTIGEETPTSGETSSTDADDTSGSDESTGTPPSCELEDSGPIVTSRDGQVIENLHVVSTVGAAITVGHDGVVLRNLWIEHAGGPGISIESATDVVIDHVAVDHTASPESGENPTDEAINIFCYDSPGLTVEHARLTRGSSGIYVLECPSPQLRMIEGHDFRGPFPRGQLVQLDKSDDAVLEDFSVINPQASSWPEDNVNVYQSVGVEIRRGLVDGNNSPSGVGVIFDGDLALGVVEDVDAIRMGNGCFSDYAGSDGVVFRRTRCRENICEDQGRGAPLSNALMWSGHEGFTQIRIEESAWFAACNDNLVWPEESFAVIELDEVDFALREPITVALCWE